MPQVATAKIIPFVSPRLDRMAEHAKMSKEFDARMRRNEEASLHFMAWREANGFKVVIEDLDEPAPQPISLFARFIGWFK